MHEILVKIKLHHQVDIFFSKKHGCNIMPLTILSYNMVSSLDLLKNERELFINYLTSMDLEWSKQNDDTNRIDWLDKHIELTKPN